MGAEEDHVVLCRACGAAMDVSEVAPYSKVHCPGCNEENLVKDQFGPYRLVHKHAIGGMSSVFKARDEALDREVALKILSEEFSKDEKRIKAFEDEARLTASFSHPNVVRVLTTGRVFDRLYIAMEFVPGGHFEHQIQEKGQVPELEVLPMAIQVAEGLKGAQSAGLIHRDVKPGNILMDSHGNAKLVDFGLALVTKGGTAQATEIWATPYYVPPEAIEGGVEDFRSDIYAFGATFYHALAGVPPCDEETMATNKLREAKKRIVPLRRHSPDLLPETCAVIERAMAYEPDMRFGSYDEMIDGLKHALKLAQGDVEVDEEGVTRAEKRVALRKKKRNTIFAISAGSALAVVAIASIILFLEKEEELPKKETVRVVESTSPSSSENKSPQAVALRYRKARTALENGNFSKSGKEFAELLADGSIQEPTRSWAGLQAIVSAMLDGRTDQARTYSKEVRDHLATSPEGLDPAFASSVQPVLSGMAALPFMRFDELVSDDPYQPSRFMGYFIAALKNWEQGGLDHALPFFEKIVSENALAGDELMSWFQSVSRDYIEDYALLKSDEMDAEPESSVQAGEFKDELNSTITLLKTKGRARFNVRARQLHLARLEKSLKNAKPIKKADPQKEIESLARNYQILDIVEKLRANQFELPAEKRTSFLQLAESAAILLNELENAFFGTPREASLETKEGTTITSMVIMENQLIGKTDSGENLDLDWSDLSAESMIELHKSLTGESSSEMERLRHSESEIAFDWLAGDRQRATESAEELSTESPAFAERWKALTTGFAD
ncbi:MAG: serine/threonine-protein kinase [Luteolibacter sp.]